MGTRSILAVETDKGVLHCQYLQFDGSVTCQGHNYYEGVLAGLLEAPEFFFDKNGNPNKNFVKRCMSYLNEAQWQTHHSFSNSWKTKIEKFYDADVWQEWQYLFKKNGDFVIFNNYSKDTFTIPWGITKSIMKGEMRYEFSRLNTQKPLEEFWKQLEDSILDKGPKVKLAAELSERQCFKEDSHDNGWRDSATLYINGKHLVTGIFGDEKYKNAKVRNAQHFETKYGG